MLPGDELLRRTWPQRLVMLAGLAVIVAALAATWWVQTIYDGLSSIGRVEIPGHILVTDTAPGEPVNFLLLGTDSGAGLDPDDPINIGRVEDPRGHGFADTIAVLRLDPVSRQAWVLPIPRDLVVPVSGSSNQRINAAHLIGGPATLVETVNDFFDIQINHYVRVDFLGFREIVDQIGGVPVWFPNPTKSVATGLDIGVAGCHVLAGADSLRYVRPRKDYSEFIAGEWVVTGNTDFERIQRQQDFLVLALDRAIQRGARDPRTMADLLQAGSQSVVLDGELTLSELRNLGESFSSFNPDNITRFALTVTTQYTDDGVYVGEILVDGADAAAIEVFRGVADAARPSEISFHVVGADLQELSGDADVLHEIGFDVVSQQQITTSVPHSVVIYPPGERASAETVASYLLPVPALAEDTLATRMTLVLGEDHEQILFLFPRGSSDTRAAIDALGEASPPDLGDVAFTTTAAPSTSAPVESDTTTTTPTTSTTVTIMGRPPEGQSCG